MSGHDTAGNRSAADAEEFERATYSKVTWRIVPFLFLCYILAYIDRVNVGFAKLEMQQDLGISDAVYGTAAGIFFIGYFFFEVPCNMILQRIGAKYWLGPIMIVWGLVSASTMFVHTANQFYAVRFLLGMVESGFFPGVILYLTFWYTRKHRVKMVAAFMSAIAVSGVVGGAMSGWILEYFAHAARLRGWQWLYLLEGLPSVLAGLATMLFLVDNPQKAKWLAPAQKELLLSRLEAEELEKRREGAGHHSLGDAFRRPQVWLLCLVYFGFVMANYGISFWLPQIIKDTVTTDPLQIGLLSMIPWGIGAIAMIVNGHHSDKTGERRWHIAIAGAVGALAFAASGIPGISGVLGLVALTLATAGVMSAVSTFWSLPTAILSGAAASAGIAWINSVGNLAGYLSPAIVGRIRDTTGSMMLALMVLSASSLIAGVAVLAVSQRRRS